MILVYVLIIVAILLAILNLFILLSQRHRGKENGNISELKGAFETFERYNREEMGRLRTELLNIRPIIVRNLMILLKLKMMYY